MDEKKKYLKFQNNIYIFIYIDKAIHANSIHNSRITISISLHPSIYPVTSPPILVQFNHVHLSHSIMIPISTLLDNGINSIYDLKLQIILRDSLTSRLIGKCYIPFNSDNNSMIKNFKHYKENDDEDLPFFFYHDSKFPILSKKQQKEGKAQSKVEICQVIFTIALGKASDKDKIIPSTTSCQEQIRFKRSFSQSFCSPPSIQTSSRQLNTKPNSPLCELNRNSTKLSPLDQSNNKMEKSIKINTNTALEKHNFCLSSNSRKRNLNSNDNTKFKPKSNKNIDINTYKFKDINAPKNKTNLSKDLTDAQIQFVIDNWEKYALKNGWLPPSKTTKAKAININDISPTRQKESKPKFLGLLNRKLLNMNQTNSTVNSNEENLICSNKNANENNQIADSIAMSDDANKNSISLESKKPKITVNVKIPVVTSSSAPTSHKKSHPNKKKNTSYFSQIQLYSPDNKCENENSKKFSSSSVVPQRTTQYQMMNECKLDDDFPDKVLRSYNSDPPPKLRPIDEYGSEKTSTDEIELFETDSECIKSVNSSPGALTESNEKPFVSVSSGDEFFFQSDPTGNHISPLMNEKLSSMRVEDAEYEESTTSERLFLSSPADLSSPSSIYALSAAINNEDQNTNESEKYNELEIIKQTPTSDDFAIICDDQLTISESSKFYSKDESAIDTTKSSFETLEAMIKMPPIPKDPHPNYKISLFDNLFDSTPIVSFGQKEIISVIVFRARPNPSEKLNTMYYSLKSSQKSKSMQKKEKTPPPLPLFQSSDSQTTIKKSPSLEKIFQDGFMDSGLNISGIYNDSSSE